MTEIKLTDAQRLVLAAATERADRSLRPLPAGLNGGAAIRW